jgi:3'-5' exoribonuclease
MTRRFVNQLTAQENFNQIFRVSEKQLRANRNGSFYIQADLSDRTGTVTARMWNASEEIFGSFDDGDYVQVDGTTQLFQGALQVIFTKIRRAANDEVTEDDFQLLTSAEIDRMVLRVGQLLRGMENIELCNLAECFLLDETFMSKFSRTPAGVKNHHAYHGGLLQHTLNLMEMVVKISPLYPELDNDQLLIGAFLHDISKTEELAFEHGFTYTVEGQLVGHLIMGVRLLEKKLDEAQKLSGEQINPETAVRLKHMILSHHGQYEFGSPKLPMTLEAITLHYLDNLDSKIAAIGGLINDPLGGEGAWTAYQPNLGRKFFKGN